MTRHYWWCCTFTVACVQFNQQVRFRAGPGSPGMATWPALRVPEDFELYHNGEGDYVDYGLYQDALSAV